MERNASLHGDAPAGETGGNSVNAELSVSSSGPSCTTSATTTTTTPPSTNANANANAASRADRADVCEMVMMMEAGGKLVQSGEEPGNELGHGARESAAGNNDAPKSKLVNKASREEPSIGTSISARADLTDQEVQEASSVCADSSAAKAKSKSKSESNEGTLSQGLPSLDSLESFSNLNSSCPSSEPVSEGLEDQEKGLVVVPQGQHGAEGGKAPSCRGGAGQSIYHIKWIRWKEENTPIITQNENGPCPLLAIMNVLLLAWKVNKNNDHDHNNCDYPQKSFAPMPEHH